MENSKGKINLKILWQLFKSTFILSAFTYDTLDDFDEEGNYRGNSIYVIRIKKK